MVPELYEYHVYGVRPLHTASYQPHPWLDNLLEPTRGKMFYQYQIKAIIRRACESSNKTEWAEFLFQGETDYLNRFDELVFDDVLSLEEAIEDRSAYDGIFWLRLFGEDEDHYIAGVLWQ